MFKFVLLFLYSTLSFADGLPAVKVSLTRTLLGVKIQSVEPSVKTISETASFRTLASSQFDFKNAAEELCPSQNCRIQLLRSIPFYMVEHGKPSNEIYEEYLVEEVSLPPRFKSFLRSVPNSDDVLIAKNAEVRVIREQGPKANRINLTILGDGYTAKERDLFFADCERVSAELFDGKTFSSYRPLFNVYAVFTPSQTSGIGEGSPKNTAFGLYRDPAGSKRAIMPGNRNALEAAIRLAPATDYPIVIANDPYYGGLGGRYAISTNSVESGMIVLRHELGHNFGEVGEEYDNGSVYSGANASRSANVPWAHWLEDGLKVNEARQLTGDYVWQNLKSSPYKKQFQVNLGADGFVYGRISSVGWETPDDVLTLVDNKPIEMLGRYTKDRSFFSIPPSNQWSKGTHTIEFRDNNGDGDNILAFATLFELPKDYDFTPHKIGAYATFNEYGSKTYRPTHDSCLMREMTVDYFCSVDQENMWFKFLSRVSLIDEIVVSGSAAELVTPPLSGLQTAWQVKGVNGIWTDIPELIGRFQTPELQRGQYRVRVEYKTPEVRKYNRNFSVIREFSIN